MLARTADQEVVIASDKRSYSARERNDTNRIASAQRIASDQEGFAQLARDAGHSGLVSSEPWETGMSRKKYSVFVCYRRDDQKSLVGRIREGLKRRLGRTNVYRDVDDPAVGDNIDKTLREIIPNCSVFLAMIGPGWLNARDSKGHARLSDPQDWVRREIELALTTPSVQVVPVLLEDAVMPGPGKLPPALEGLRSLEAANIRDTDFDHHIEKLIVELKERLPNLKLWPGRRPLTAATLILAAFGLMAALLFSTQAWRLGQASNGSNDPQSASARHAPVRSGAQQEIDDCEQASWCPKMIVLPAGNFLMGSPANEVGRRADEAPQIETTVRSFAMSKYEITFAQWDACVSEGGCRDYRPSDDGSERDNRPVAYVSWYDAEAYVHWLSNQTGKTYRLPTEAEWEYGARADSSTAYWFGDRFDPGVVASGPHSLRVGSRPSNGWGLFDLTGNVSEWTADCYVERPDAPVLARRPIEPADCSQRAVRGGSWNHGPDRLRSASRDGGDPNSRSAEIGLRVARTVD